jgi:CRISPR-associated endonuclease/helicase Cas3
VSAFVRSGTPGDRRFGEATLVNDGDAGRSKPATQLEDAFAEFWGKARDQQPWPYHPLAYHSLDVGACAHAILRARPLLGRVLARLLGGVDQDAAERLVVLLALVHDLGKFALSFQSLSPEACAAVATACVPGLPYDKKAGTGHDTLGLWLWRSAGSAVAEAVLDDAAGDPTIRLLLGSATFGHHGAPPDIAALERNTRPSQLNRIFPLANRQAAGAFANACRCLVGDGPIAVPSDEEAARRASLLIAAIVNVADWLGSSTIYFPYRAPDLALADYWDCAIRCAEAAVAGCGLVPPPVQLPGMAGAFSALFPEYDPTPLQQLADTTALSGQFLAILEDATGSGKTEASLTLARRAIAAGAGGLFFGLPTTITADGQARRQAEVYRRLFGNGAAASMTVAHSLADQRALRAAGVDCASWIADERRLRLLADVSVGTADQALLAAMPARFATLRIFGLCGKLLVLDEIHAYDSYTARLVEALLALHGALGGSAVLLSATLTSDLKRRFTDAFGDAVGSPRLDRACFEDKRYPLMTLLDQNGGRVVAVDLAPDAPPNKRVRFARTVAEAERAVLDAAREGKCVAWIRNIVDQAIETGAKLRGEHPDVTVFHSRFPERDRDLWRRLVLRRFGKKSGHRLRTGAIMVATAIIEQSLDIDFDLVVVDLKPMDVLLQAIGRALRHLRDAAGNRLEKGALDGRTPEVIVVGPDSNEVRGPGWYGDMLGNAAYVHEDPAVLWRTARLLEQAGSVIYGPETRRLVEQALLGCDDLAVPECLVDAEIRAEGNDSARRGFATSVANKAGIATGYVKIEASLDDNRFPTRLGDAVEIVLVRRVDGELKPFRGLRWSSGRLRVAASQLRGATQLTDTEQKFVATLVPYALSVLVSDAGDGLCAHDGSTVAAFRACRRQGLLWEKSRDSEIDQ